LFGQVYCFIVELFGMPLYFWTTRACESEKGW